MNQLAFIAIDDDPLFIRKIEAFAESIDWIEKVESFDNPVKGATAIVAQQPDVVLLDIEMPYIDGEYLIDWIKPQFELMEKPPRVIVVSSVSAPSADLAANTLGFINKASITDPQSFEAALKSILD